MTTTTKVFTEGATIEIQVTPGAPWITGSYMRRDPEWPQWHWVKTDRGAYYVPTNRVRHPKPVTTL